MRKLSRQVRTGDGLVSERHASDPMTAAPVGHVLIGMAAPIALGMLSTFLFQIVDTYFVGKLGSAELAALAFSSTAYLVLVSVFMGLSVGVSSVVARAAGSDQGGRANRMATIALGLALALSVGLCLLARSLISPMFSLLGAGEELLPLVRQYMGILYLGFPFLMLGIVGSGAVRAIGITGQTELVFAGAGILNLIFDWLLIFGKGPFPELGLAGAAIATVLSFVFIFLGVMAIMRRHGLLGFAGLRSSLVDTREMLAVSVPTISMQVLVPATGMFMAFLLSGYGTTAVAAFGIASRIEALALIGIYAASMSVTPFVARNFGAGEHDRIDDALVFAGKLSVCLGLMLFAGLALLGPWVARIFSDEPEVIRSVTLYFRIVAASYAFQGIFNMTVATFNGLQMPGEALRLMVVRTFAMVLPLSLFGSFFGFGWILAGYAAGSAVAAGYAVRRMRQSQRKWNRPIAATGTLAETLRDVRSLWR